MTVHQLEFPTRNLTQAEQILDHLQHHGPLTAIDALDLFGCFRLAARIRELRLDGHIITSSPFRTRGGKIISEYRLNA